MLKLKDNKTGKVKFVVRDTDTSPIDVDTAVLEDEANNSDEDEQPATDRKEEQE